MILPQNGSVVIIDDQPKEALPIIQALSKKGISTTYYQDSNPNLLPESPTQLVRMVFLDLQLIETADEHQIAKSIVNILQKIISDNNGPYILVIWSKNGAKYEATVLQEIEQFSHLIPACTINFNKRDCLEEKIVSLVDENEFVKNVLDSLTGRIEDEDEKFVKQAITDALRDEYRTEFVAKDDAIDIIENYIKTELEAAGVLHLFIIWENLIRQAAAETVYAVSNTIDSSDLWEENMRDVVKRMGRARTGLNELTNEELLKASMTTFTYSFSEQIESKLREYEFPDYIDLESEFIISKNANGSNFQIRQFFDNGPKVQLLRNGEVVKGKEKISFYAIERLSDGITPDFDKATVNEMSLNYQKIPYQINTKLHLELNPNRELVPGNVYRVDISDEKKEEYLLTYFEKIEGNLDNYTFIELEVSPICDYAQTKWKKSRLISGVIYSEKVKAKKLNHFYAVDPPLLVEGSRNIIVFDFHLFKSLDMAIVKEREIWFRLKRELLLDIIANLSGHVNRPGIAFMS